MLDLEPIFQFSRNNCVAICSFLVPANLFTTVATLVLTLNQSPLIQLRYSAALAIIFALTLFSHVATWFTIGVITPVTFILAGLGTTCIITNLVLVIYHSAISKYFVSWKQTIKDFAKS